MERRMTWERVGAKRQSRPVEFIGGGDNSRSLTLSAEVV